LTNSSRADSVSMPDFAVPSSAETPRPSARHEPYYKGDSTMSTGSVPIKETSEPKAKPVDMKFEIVVLPVSNVDRAKAFYSKLGWRLDAEFGNGDDFRIMQFTPPGSGCSVIFGKNVTAAAPGSSQGLYLIVSDVEAARRELIERGVEVSEVFHNEGVYA